MTDVCDAVGRALADSGPRPVLLAGRKTLVIGQAPAKQTVGKPAFSGKSGPKFAELLGVPFEELHQHFDLTNLLDFFPGPSPGEKDRGDRFPIFEAKKRALDMLPELDGRTVVFVGKNVARAFGYSRDPYFRWVEQYVPYRPEVAQGRRGAAAIPSSLFFTYAIVPHPSGISHFWNDPENVETARRFMRTIPR